jgi:A/G-specific adenine glycosylase
MLQQTQVETVLRRFYAPFLDRFPTIHAIAEASLEDVLQCWQGLGYYRRARHLHQASQQCSNGLPNTLDGLLSLPGVGKNTAHAVLCFGHGHPLAVMEANVKRLIHRWLASPKLPETVLWSVASWALDDTAPYLYNQAIMDVGATICTPTHPSCDLCPFRGWCRGRDDPSSYPERRDARPVPVRRSGVWVVAHPDRLGYYAMRPRLEDHLHGCYGFVALPLDDAPPGATIVGMVSQSYSHFRHEVTVWYEIRSELPAGGWEWKEAEAVPLSGLERKILEQLKAVSTTPH